MDSITGTIMAKAGALLDEKAEGNVHTVTLTLDGRTGGCQVTIEEYEPDEGDLPDLVLTVR